MKREKIIFSSLYAEVQLASRIAMNKPKQWLKSGPDADDGDAQKLVRQLSSIRKS